MFLWKYNFSRLPQQKGHCTLAEEAACTVDIQCTQLLALLDIQCTQLLALLDIQCTQLLALLGSWRIRNIVTFL